MNPELPFALRNKTIMVTGSASGIGRCTAIACAMAGAKLILADINEEGLKETLSLLKTENCIQNHEIRVADLSTDEGLTALIDTLSILDGVVFCAGIGITKTIPFYSREDFYRVFDINFFAPVLLTKLLVKKKKLSKVSSLVYLVLVAGVFSFKPGNGIYGASKSALHGFVKFAALELAAKGIRCNAVCPAMVETPFLQTVSLSQEDIENDKKKYPFKRYAQPEEIAQGCVFLLSDASSYMTGQDLVLDGGRLLN